jgi:acetoin:2,6-dichlorophenolindophenol oxidoreductase subunit beta
MAEIEFRQAIATAIAEEMDRDGRVILMGEDVAFAGGVFQATRGLYRRFGPTRVVDTPISELALAGAAFGAAVSGLRPIIEIMFGDFLLLAMDSLVNQSAKYWYMSNGQASVPLVIRCAVGGGGRFGPIHSQIPLPWLLGVPGLKVVAPSTACDARSLLVAAIRDDNPVVFLEHKRLYGLKGETSDEIGELGAARLVRSGGDVTIVSSMTGVRHSMAAASELAAAGTECEVIDLRTLRPLDTRTILDSVAKTGRLIAVEEGPRTGGWSAEVLALVAESGLPVQQLARVTGPDLPLPFSGPLEDACLPTSTAIVTAIKEKRALLGSEVRT